jgi:hypothetical protein
MCKEEEKIERKITKYNKTTSPNFVYIHRSMVGLNRTVLS